MKNIHVIATDKPSRLFIIDKSKMFLSEPPHLSFSTVGGKVHKIEGSELYQPQNIYITNDEEIKKDEFYLGDDNHIYCLCTTVSSNGKKIILTTNADLIDEGIQAIDDEFLEWFVKNPSCEEVEVELQIKSVQLPQKQLSKNSYDLSFRWIDIAYYKIIIPKQEPKQTKWDKLNKELDDALELEFSLDKSIFDKMASLSESKEPKKESVFETAKSALRKHLLENKEKVAADLEEMRERSNTNKQETLEEAAERSYSEGVYIINGIDICEASRECFIEGAKWQQERMYSEEIELINWLQSLTAKKFYSSDAEDLIEQFKKK